MFQIQKTPITDQKAQRDKKKILRTTALLIIQSAGNYRPLSGYQARVWVPGQCLSTRPQSVYQASYMTGTLSV